MNARVSQGDFSLLPPSSRLAAPRTLVNSSTTAPYVPSKSAPLRSGANDYKRQPTKGQPT